jgi:formamidopyrimidine-DNA glycosylase
VPELPEVEAARRSLARTAVGKTVERAVVRRPVAIRTHSPLGFARAVRGATITEVARHGKSLWFLLDSWALIFHYKLSGVVRFHEHAPEPDGATALLLVFAGGSALEFRQLQLSSFHLLRRDEAASAADGVEPLAATTTFEVFRRAIHSRGMIKDALSRQDRITGIGNLWAHEILFRAGIRPNRKVETLTPEETRRLYRRTRQVLRSAVEAGGEPDFEDALGRAGRYRLAVYGRAGDPCAACGTKIRGGRLHGRPTFFCPSCQT